MYLAKFLDTSAKSFSRIIIACIQFKFTKIISAAIKISKKKKKIQIKYKNTIYCNSYNLYCLSFAYLVCTWKWKQDHFDHENPYLSSCKSLTAANYLTDKNNINFPRFIDRAASMRLVCARISIVARFTEEKSDRPGCMRIGGLVGDDSMSTFYN